MDASCEQPLQKSLSRSPLSRRLSGSATTVIRIIMPTRDYTMQVGNPYRPPMKHPVRSDFHSVVTEAGVSVTFKPTNSIYCFYRVTDTNDIARLGPVSFAGVQHAGRNTEDYPSDEVQDMAQRIASDFTAFCASTSPSHWRRQSSLSVFGPPVTAMQRPRPTRSRRLWSGHTRRIVRQRARPSESVHNTLPSSKRRLITHATAGRSFRSSRMVKSRRSKRGDTPRPTTNHAFANGGQRTPITTSAAPQRAS
jgi:hypothetical protein